MSLTLTDIFAGAGGSSTGASEVPGVEVRLAANHWPLAVEVHTPKPVTDPLDTVTASGNHHGLMDVSEDDVMACRFRMLEPHEIAAGMAFPADYLWAGTKRERVRMAGNAVTPPAARDLVTIVAESLGAAA